MSSERPRLADADQRERFVTETMRNFSVVAPAGVGKTTAIVDRIVHLAAQDSSAARILPRLVLVTYTRKAAQEMSLRARSELVKAHAGAETMAQLGKAYFGTIHSYCLKLVQRFALKMGLPPELEIVTDTAELWARFLRSRDELYPQMNAETRKAIHQLMPQTDLLKLAQEVPFGIPSAVRTDLHRPVTDIGPILEVKPKGRSAANILRWQRLAQQWERAFEEGKNAPIPQINNGGKEIIAAGTEAFGPLKDWLSEVSLEYAQGIAQAFFDFRRNQGKVSYDDIVLLALEVVKNPEYAAELRAEAPIILLDEAQDTDEFQFEVLLELARPAKAAGRWLELGTEPPESGRFCMVGDPQQSIYSSRANVYFYEKVRQQLVEQGAAEELAFTVTMRCDEHIVAKMNRWMPSLLNGTHGQVAFVDMQSRPDAAKGQVVFAKLAQETKDIAPDIAYAKAFAKWLKAQSPSALQASAWEQVAILCPRKAWLSLIYTALKEQGVNAQLVSGSECYRDNPAYIWITALLKVMTDPYNSFELAGILREVFTVSDGEIARYCGQYYHREAPHPLNLVAPPQDDSAPCTYLTLLKTLRERAETLALHDLLEHLVNGCGLKERLQALPEFNAEESLAMLDRLLVEADNAEDRRMSPDEWVKDLEKRLADDLPEGQTLAGAVQLLTMHKAKGLGFQAVILPFFYRGMKDRADHYPYYFRRGNCVVIDKEQDDGSIKACKDDTSRQEKERLLYVAMTRARHTLVIFDDREWFKNNKSSCGELLECTPQNELDLAQLPEALISGERNEENENPLEFEPGIHPNYGATGERLKTDWNRITPSSLAHHDAPMHWVKETALSNDFAKDEAEAVMPMDPTIYGNWWHGVMESVDWNSNEADIKAQLNEGLESCPAPDRGRSEMERFLESELLGHILKFTGRRYTEVPFLFGNSEGTAYEGYIDFLAINEEEVLLIDWKTDRQSVEQIATSYTPQLRAYREALSTVYERPVRSSLYSTVNGQHISIE
ncbi:MAG: UvrD-helicase domain-containing protein [Opitutales bacterium]|nr:UvrD-helicase domain-containing protein [Opitutales bacterium]